jgi:DNA invertase Pin-like site-specific DNA recombinase
MNGRGTMKIGYVRVSTQEQHEALQVDALKAAGCEKWSIDKITGSQFERKGWAEILAFVRPGDTVVVWKLDRLGRSRERPYRDTERAPGSWGGLHQFDPTDRYDD